MSSKTKKTIFFLFFFYFTIIAVDVDTKQIESQSNQIISQISKISKISQLDRPVRERRLANLFFNPFSNSPVCTGCPNRYCDTDPAIILGYCCGCRTAFDILPVYCAPTILCPSYLRDVCHDYEYMLHCCC